VSTESAEVDEIRRGAYELLCALAVMLWMAAVAVCDVGLMYVGFRGITRTLDHLRRHGLLHNLEHYVECFVDCVFYPFMWPFYLITLIITAPLIVRVLEWLREVMLVSTTPIPDADLSALSPGLRGLVADARVLRVALEVRDEGSLRAVWDWQRRFEQLGEADRRELEHLGLGDPGIADRLHWIVGMTGRERLDRGMREIIGALELFEQRLLDADSLFRGPFR
jgi:hypothetical protein